MKNAPEEDKLPEAQDSRRSTTQKFLSVKSIVRNKKLIIKKSLPSSQLFFSPRQGITSENATYPEEPQLNKQQSTPSNTSVVNILFKDNHTIAERMGATGSGSSHDPKYRKRVASYLVPEETGTSLLSHKSGNKSVFEELLCIEPLNKNSEMLFPFERKKGFQHYITMSKKNRKPHAIDVVGSHRTIPELKPLSKQIPLVKAQEQEKRNRSTIAAFNRKTANERQKAPDKDKTWYRQTNSKQTKKQEDQNREAERQQEKLQLERMTAQFKDFFPLRRPVLKKEYFVFGMSQKPSNQLDNRIQLYRDLLWKVNYSNCLYVATPETNDSCYRAYFGSGNNSCMLKSIMRRRSWWNIVETAEGCQFVWTQLKLNSLFKLQESIVAQAHDEREGRRQLYEQVRESGAFNQQWVSSERAHAKLLNSVDWDEYLKYVKRNSKYEQKLTEQTYTKRLSLFAHKQINKISDSNKLKVHNHLEFNYYIGNKKALFYNIRRLCECKGLDPFKFIPLTYHICKGINDPIYQSFLEHFNSLQKLKKTDKSFRNIWIAKPGQNSNRGNGISVCYGIDDVKHRLRGREKNSDGKPRTFILQKYIEKPFLYKGRKFDIRHFLLLTCINGSFKAYWFQEGYVRTSSCPFNLKNGPDVMVHLTNDAVQKKSQLYGKHEKGNKISYQDFQKYLDTNYRKKKYNFLNKTLRRMKEVALLAVEATYSLLDPQRRQHNFELIGLDFMIDQDFHPWLIEANTNPCMELSCPLLEKLLPNVIEQTLRICVDPLFPPPENLINRKQFIGQNCLLENRFELIFDERMDGAKVEGLLRGGEERGGEEFREAMEKIEEDDEVFEDDGNERWEQKVSEGN